MFTQNPIILTELSNQKLRELRAEGDAARLAKLARPERSPRIRIAAEPAWLRRVRQALSGAHLPYHR